MLQKVKHIAQPTSGEYEERIFDIKNPWNSGEWSWVEFEEETGFWCGEFRGEFRGAALSRKWGVAVILTSDYMFILDIVTCTLIDYASQPMYSDITVTPSGDILITDGYGIEKFTGEKHTDTESIVLPLNTDYLHFMEYNNGVLRIVCYELCVWGKEIELFLDYNSFDLL